MRLKLIILALMVSTAGLTQSSLPYRDAAASADKATVTGLFISFESLTPAERRLLDLTPFPELQSIEFLSGVPNDVRLDSAQYASITHLSLNDCGLSVLPRWIMRGETIGFTKLASLSVRVNKLKQVSICNLENLVVLDVSFNKGINVNCLRSSSTLTQLSADGSGLDLCQLPLGLTHLSAQLHSGRIAMDELSCLSALAGLRSLDISSNAISAKHLLRYLDASAIDSLYLNNVSISAKKRTRLRSRTGLVLFYNERPPRAKANPIDSESTIWRPSY